jgi:hypothetical protein
MLPELLKLELRVALTVAEALKLALPVLLLLWDTVVL